MPGRLTPLRIYYVASFAALGAYVPFFPHWLEARGIHGIAMGAIVATVPAMGVVGPPVFGVLSDALGLRGILLRVACFGSSLAFAVIAAAGALGLPLGFGALFVTVLVFALFRSPMVMLGDVIALERAPAAGTTYAKIRLYGSLGFLVAALATGRLLDPARLVPLPLVIAVALFAALLAAWTLPARAAVPPSPALPHARALLARAPFRVFLAASFLAQAAHASYDLCFSLHLRDLGASSHLVGASWAFGVLCEVALMAGAAPLFARFTPQSLLAAALLGASARWALLSTVRTLPVLFALQPLHAISFGLMWVASLAYTKEAAPTGALATAQGLFTAACAAGSVVGMLAWGALYRRSGGGVTFASASVLAASAALLALAWARRAEARRDQLGRATP